MNWAPTGVITRLNWSLVEYANLAGEITGVKYAYRAGVKA